MSDSENLILASIENKVMTIRINRPEKKNALTEQMYADMTAALKEANASDEVNVIAFLGTSGAFSAGNDIADFIKGSMTKSHEDDLPVLQFLEEIIPAPKPIVAGVDGLAIGIGTTLLFHCDVVLSSPTSTFKTPFVDLGLVPEAGSSLIAPEIIGYHNAFALLAMGEKFDTTRAQSAGFVTHIVEGDALEARTLEVAIELAAKPQQALKLSRDLIRGDRTAVLTRMREEAVLFSERTKSEEAKQAFMAFMQKGMKG